MSTKFIFLLTVTLIQCQIFFNSVFFGYIILLIIFIIYLLETFHYAKLRTDRIE